METAGFAQDEQGWYVFSAGATGALISRHDTEEQAQAAAEKHNGKPFDFEDGTGV